MVGFFPTVEGHDLVETIHVGGFFLSVVLVLTDFALTSSLHSHEGCGWLTARVCVVGELVLFLSFLVVYVVAEYFVVGDPTLNTLCIGLELALLLLHFHNAEQLFQRQQRPTEPVLETRRLHFILFLSLLALLVLGSVVAPLLSGLEASNGLQLQEEEETSPRQLITSFASQLLPPAPAPASLSSLEGA